MLIEPIQAESTEVLWLLKLLLGHKLQPIRPLPHQLSIYTRNLSFPCIPQHLSLNTSQNAFFLSGSRYCQVQDTVTELMSIYYCSPSHYWTHIFPPVSLFLSPPFLAPSSLECRNFLQIPLIDCVSLGIWSVSHLPYNLSFHLMVHFILCNPQVVTVVVFLAKMVVVVMMMVKVVATIHLMTLSNMVIIAPMLVWSLIITQGDYPWHVLTRICPSISSYYAIIIWYPCTGLVSPWCLSPGLVSPLMGFQLKQLTVHHLFAFTIVFVRAATTVSKFLFNVLPAPVDIE